MAADHDVGTYVVDLHEHSRHEVLRPCLPGEAGVELQSYRDQRFLLVSRFPERSDRGAGEP